MDGCPEGMNVMTESCVRGVSFVYEYCFVSMCKIISDIMVVCLKLCPTESIFKVENLICVLDLIFITAYYIQEHYAFNDNLQL